MKRGTLNGLESCWDSPFLGERKIEWDADPQPGERFRFRRDGRLWDHCYTSEVTSVSPVPGAIRFRTRNTTYILEVDDVVRVTVQ